MAILVRHPLNSPQEIPTSSHALQRRPSTVSLISPNYSNLFPTLFAFITHMRQLCYFFLLLLAIGLGACSNDAPPQAAAVRHRDSLPLMTSYGISKLISDSGVVRYKIMTEEWRFFDRTHPPRNEFLKGIFLQRYDAKFNVDLYITADTAYWYDQKLWELRGRVRVRNLQDGTPYTSQPLYWDNEKHEFYSNVPMHIVTPDRDLQGDRFRSDEQLTRYEVRRTRGFIPMPSSMSSNSSGSTTPDTTNTAQ